MAIRSITKRAQIDPAALRTTLLYDVTASRFATAGIQGLLPNRTTKIMIAEAAQWVQGCDLDAIIIFQWASLASQDERLSQKDVADVVSEELRAKRATLGDYVEPILTGLEEAGLIERKELLESKEGADRTAGPTVASYPSRPAASGE